MGELRRSLTDGSGGLTYHWRALRYQHTLWRPFCVQVAQWLAGWQPPQRSLLIVGPSAGYSLPAGFLARFSRISILEPDPLARRLLSRRFPGAGFVAGNLDCMASLAGPACLAAEYPDSAILFSNVIGQRLEELPSGWAQSLQASLYQHSWASYHDIISTEVPPTTSEACRRQGRETLEQVLAAFWQTAELSLHDHCTFAAIPAQEYAIWQILPSRFHLIGWRSQISG